MSDQLSFAERLYEQDKQNPPFRDKCNYCNKKMIWDPGSISTAIETFRATGGERVYRKKYFYHKFEYQFYCKNCDMYFSWNRSISQNGNVIRQSRSANDADLQYYEATPEQTALAQELDKQRQPVIIPDKEFHDEYCRLMDEILHKKCQCYGKDIADTQ